MATRIAVRPFRIVGARKKAPLPTSRLTICRLSRSSSASPRARPGRPVAEADDREHRLGQQLEVLPRPDRVGQEARHRHVVLDRRRVAAAPVVLQADPHLERLEAARELRARAR